MTNKKLDNGIIEMMPDSGFRLVKVQDRIAAQGSVFLPSKDFSEGWEERPIAEVNALEEKWEKEIESEGDSDE